LDLELFANFRIGFQLRLKRFDGTQNLLGCHLYESIARAWRRAAAPSSPNREKIESESSKSLAPVASEESPSLSQRNPDASRDHSREDSLLESGNTIMIVIENH
jgi:hypothetical protein